MNNLEAFNQTLFLRLNADAPTSAWILSTAAIIADDLIYLVPLLLVAFWFEGNTGRRSMALKACLVALVSLGINQLIGLVYSHPRPVMIGLGHTWIPHAADSSFPSDHMTVFVSIGLTLLLDGARWRGLATLIAGLAVAWSRVFLGVHFPLDMLGAAAVVVVTYALITPVWRHVGSAVTQWGIWLYGKLFAKPINLGWIRR